MPAAGPSSSDQDVKLEEDESSLRMRFGTPTPARHWTCGEQLIYPPPVPMPTPSLVKVERAPSPVPFQIQPEPATLISTTREPSPTPILPYPSPQPTSSIGEAKTHPSSSPVHARPSPRGRRPRRPALQVRAATQNKVNRSRKTGQVAKFHMTLRAPRR